MTPKLRRYVNYSRRYNPIDIRDSDDSHLGFVHEYVHHIDFDAVLG